MHQVRDEYAVVKDLAPPPREIASATPAVHGTERLGLSGPNQGSASGEHIQSTGYLHSFLFVHVGLYTSPSFE
jgi:hypothetical protein